MLIPKRVKYRRQHRPTRTGVSKGGNRINFGDYAIQALEPAYITNRQIEAARIAINRHVKRGGKVWICLLYTSPSPRDLSTSRMPSSA